MSEYDMTQLRLTGKMADLPEYRHQPSLMSDRWLRPQNIAADGLPVGSETTQVRFAIPAAVRSIGLLVLKFADLGSVDLQGVCYPASTPSRAREQ
jgi:hypothetical protein